MSTITVYHARDCVHIARLLTGFHMLGQQGLFDIRFCDDTVGRNIPNVEVVEAEVNGHRIAFDMGDRWALAHENGRQYLKEVDAYFARDFTTEVDIVNPAVDSHDFKKVFPFGFNYYSTFSGNPADGAAPDIKHRIIGALKDLSGYNNCTYPEYFEGKADFKESDFKIIFLARLWDAATLPKYDNPSEAALRYRNYMVDEWQGINETRIAIIRELRSQYGKSFFGGIQHCSLAEKLCPELIVPASVVRKKSYLDRMKSSDICIGSMGLHKSIGWKTGEYIAAARAIVAEKLRYDVPGNFDDGRHYIPFSTADECVEAVGKLYKNPEMIYEMKKANEEYYGKYLKPDVQVLNALRIVLGDTV